jgi:KTSC domain
MKMTSVKSSQIKAVGHDPKTKTLAVEFNGGGLYHYPNVTAEQHKALMEAESIGSHFHKNIKINPDHPHKKIVPEE